MPNPKTIHPTTRDTVRGLLRGPDPVLATVWEAGFANPAFEQRGVYGVTDTALVIEGADNQPGSMVFVPLAGPFVFRIWSE